MAYLDRADVVIVISFWRIYETAVIASKVAHEKGAALYVITDAITAVQDALKGTDITALKTAVETLSTESQQLGAALYSQTQSEGGSADGGATSGAQDDEIVDAEIVDDPKPDMTK